MSRLPTLVVCLIISMAVQRVRSVYGKKSFEEIEWNLNGLPLNIHFLS